MVSALLPPAGDATPEEEKIRWTLLVNVFLIAILIGCLVTSYPILSPQTLYSAPRGAMILGLSTMLISQGLAPFSNDTYLGVPCPCHWNESFNEQFTTISILAAYAPMKYVIWGGFYTVAFLIIITAFVGIRKWWDHPFFGQYRKKRAVLLLWFFSMLVLAFSLSAELVFARHFDRKLHIVMGYFYFGSAASVTVFGHVLIRWETMNVVSRREKAQKQILVGHRLSMVSMFICIVLSLWFLYLFLKQTAMEGIMALSEHLLVGSQLFWMDSLYHVFLAGCDDEDDDARKRS